MPEIVLPAAGGCRCGALRFEITAPPMATSACHCRGCQRMSGSAYSLTTMVPVDGFRVTQGRAIPGGLRQGTAHMHCSDCLSWVFTRPEGIDFFVNVRSTMLDTPSTTVPFLETCLSEALPFARLNAPHGFDGFPAPDQFQPLLEDYAASRP